MKVSYLVDDYVGWKPEQFKDFHTKQLLNLLNRCHTYFAGCEYWWCDSDEGYLAAEKVKAITETLKVVLATREHVPNKKERKAMRQLAAKRKT